MTFPHLVHFFNWDILCFWQVGENEDCPDEDKPNEEEEEAKLHVTKHEKEKIGNYKCEEYVKRDDGLSCFSDLKSTYFT